MIEMNIQHELDQLESCIKDLEDSIAKIKEQPAETEYETQVLIIDLKRQKLRVMAFRARTRSLVDNLDWMLEKIQLGLEVKNLANKKKSNVLNDESSPKKIKLSSETKSEKHKSKSRSSRSNKENRKKVTSSPKKHTSRTQKKASEPQVSIGTAKSVPPPAPKSLPCSLPLQNLPNNIWPVHAKKTIFLNNPPIRDSNINKNVGYYSIAHAKEILGYDPDTLPKVQTQGNRTNCNSSIANASSSTINQQACPTQLNRAYNLSVSPGYNLSVLPGFVVKHQAQVHQTEGSDAPNTNVKSSHSGSAPKVSSPTNEMFNADESEGNNSDTKATNKLFRDLMCNKNVIKDEDIHSLASIETLVIATNIDGDFQDLNREY